MGADDLIDGFLDGLADSNSTTWTWGPRRRRSGDLSAWDAEGVRLARQAAATRRRAVHRSGRRRWFAPWTRWPVVHPTQAQAALRSRLAQLASEADSGQLPPGTRE
jgi:hypothetical protein